MGVGMENMIRQQLVAGQKETNTRLDAVLRELQVMNQALAYIANHPAPPVNLERK